MDSDYLVKKAIEAQGKAYAPYSRYRVGAALLAKSGQVYTGCNVENAAYGLSNCAERTAIFKAVSQGDQAFEAIAIVGDSDDFCTPCGSCRQVMAEFGDDLKVITANPQGKYQVKTIQELLPGAFGKEMLHLAGKSKEEVNA